MPELWSAPEMKQNEIKVIKRNVVLGTTIALRKKRHMPPSSVTATVTDWIAESRQKKLDQNSFSFDTIARWASESSS